MKPRVNVWRRRRRNRPQLRVRPGYRQMTDAELLRDAIDVTGLSPFRFATEVLDVDAHGLDRKSTRPELQSHRYISYAVFCLKKTTLDTESDRPSSVRARPHYRRTSAPP